MRSREEKFFFSDSLFFERRKSQAHSKILLLKRQLRFLSPRLYHEVIMDVPTSTLEALQYETVSSDKEEKSRRRTNVTIERQSFDWRLDFLSSQPPSTSSTTPLNPPLPPLSVPHPQPLRARPRRPRQDDAHRPPHRLQRHSPSAPGGRAPLLGLARRRAGEGDHDEGVVDLAGGGGTGGDGARR